MKYTEAILSNSARKLLWFEITKILTDHALTAVHRINFIVLGLCIIIIGILLFPINIE